MIDLRKRLFGSLKDALNSGSCYRGPALLALGREFFFESMHVVGFWVPNSKLEQVGSRLRAQIAVFFDRCGLCNDGVFIKCQFIIMFY